LSRGFQRQGVSEASWNFGSGEIKGGPLPLRHRWEELRGALEVVFGFKCPLHFVLLPPAEAGSGPRATSRITAGPRQKLAVARATSFCKELAHRNSCFSGEKKRKNIKEVMSPERSTLQTELGIFPSPFSYGQRHGIHISISNQRNGGGGTRAIPGAALLLLSRHLPYGDRRGQLSRGHSPSRTPSPLLFMLFPPQILSMLGRLASSHLPGGISIMVSSK